MPLTDDQAQRLVEHVVAEVESGRMSEAQGRAYANRVLNEAFTLQSGTSAAEPPVDHAAGYVAPDDTRIAVRLMHEDGLSRAQIADRLEKNGIDAQLRERIEKRQASLLAEHVKTQEALAADAPDARRAQAQAELQAAETLKRDSLLARQYIVAEGLLPEGLATELTDREAVDMAFGEGAPLDAGANDLAANIAAASKPKPEQWTPGGESQ